MTLPTTLNVTRPVAEGYGALITYGADAGDDLYVQLAPTNGNPIRRITADVGAQMPSVARNPEDFRPESGRIWSRARWSGGEGLARAHKPDLTPFDETRFWASKDIAFRVPQPGQQEGFFLAWKDEAVTGTTAATPYAAKLADGTRIYWADGSDVVFSDDILTDAVGDHTYENPGTLSTEGSQTITGVALDGRIVYAALNGAGSIHQRTGAATWNAWSNLQADRVWVAKRRVIASDGNILYDAYAGAASVQLKTLAAGETWTDVVDAGHLILAAATDGKIYAFSDESGSLLLRGETEMRPGEVPFQLEYADGLVFIGVGDENIATGYIGRLYVAQMAGTRLRNTQLLRTWGDEASVVDHTPGGMSVTRDEVLIPVLDDDGYDAVWAYNLATAGMYKRLAREVAGAQPRQVFEIDDRLVLFRDAALIIRTSSIYQPSGWLMTPYADFYSASKKSIVGLRIDNVDIPAAGAKINLYYSTDPASLNDPTDSGWVLAKSLTWNGDRSTESEIMLTEVSGRGVALMIELVRTTATTGTPEVRSVAARVFEQLEEVLIELPVNVSDVIERPGKSPLRVPGRGEAVYAKLRDIEGEPATVLVLRTGETVQGRVEQVSMSQPTLTPRGPSMLVAAVVARGVKV